MASVVQRDSGARAGRRSESGQVIVEQALVMPMMVFLVLGIVQLTMLQHARLATEYAAFNAARSGVVYNGDPEKMTNAALVSLIPTYRRADSAIDFATRYVEAQIIQALTEAILGVPMVEVTILEPSNADIFQTHGVHMNRQQVDFDDYRTEVAEFNLLSIEVRYYYEMRIPFANWMIQSIWFANQVGNLENWGGPAFLAPEQEFAGFGTGQHAMTVTDILAAGEEGELAMLVLVRRGLGRYYMPLRSWYTMRMQSNFYQEFLPEG
jgi:hypothetical protein